MNTDDLSFGQKIDPATGLVMAWLTHGALDEIAAMDLSDKIILEYGAGLGDAWLATRCKKLYVIERNPEWLIKSREIVLANGITNIEYIPRPCNDCFGKEEYYCEVPEGVKPDVFISDDAYRYECILKAIEYKPCILIVDNGQQDYVFISPAAEEAVKPYEGKCFIQADHENHEGRPWQTGIWN